LSTFVVSREQAKSRLDALVRELGSLSQKKAKLLCASGGVAVNGVCAAGTARVREGAKITFHPELADLTLKLGLPVVYADDDVLVLQKPPGLMVQASTPEENSVQTALDEELPGSNILHHLDREASGLLLVGRTPEAIAELGAAIREGKVSREYVAIAHGSIEADEQTIELAIATTDEPRNPTDHVEGKTATSHVVVIARRDGATHIRVTLTTGRAHHIRRHLQSIGHPLLGDARFGDAEANDRARASWGVHRTLLHGKSVQFPHPSTGEVVTVTATDEPDFARIFPNRADR
jgi:RluA family pseudouridine synthase